MFLKAFLMKSYYVFEKRFLRTFSYRYIIKYLRGESYKIGKFKVEGIGEIISFQNGHSINEILQKLLN